jgi:peptide deformylase
MVHEILLWPDPRLEEKAAPVGGVDAAVRRLIDDMFETMYAAEGTGLAAPQIGVSKRVVVIDSSYEDDVAPFAMVDPVIVARDGETRFEYACLSIPDEAERVTRAARVRVRFLDREGRARELEATGLTAIAIQHECDHLDGVLYVDYLSSLKRGLIRKRMKRRKRQLEESGGGTAAM